MFSGIVEESARVVSSEAGNSGSKLIIESKLDHADTAIGDSICISGVCLTVVSKSLKSGATQLGFECAPETLRRTTLGELKPGSPVNIERSLQAGSRLHGHFVTGHVDCVASLISRQYEGNSIVLEISFPPQIGSFIAEKGSVCLAGVSLTVGAVGEKSFKVYIIPHTAQVTTMGALKPGDKINLEVDILARYVVSALSNPGAADSTAEESLAKLLSSQGYIAGSAEGKGSR